MHKRNNPSFIQFLPGIAWFFVVLLLLCMPGEKIPKSKWLSIIFFDKMVHVACFGLLVVLFYWPLRRQAGNRLYLARLAIATVVWGITTEFIQKFFILHRSFDLLDWLADSTGALLAWWGLLAWQKRKSG